MTQARSLWSKFPTWVQVCAVLVGFLSIFGSVAVAWGQEIAFRSNIIDRLANEEQAREKSDRDIRNTHDGDRNRQSEVLDKINENTEKILKVMYEVKGRFDEHIRK